MELKLDAVDSVILRFIIDFYNNGKMKNMYIDQREYVWINYGSAINELPILAIRKRAFSNRMSKFVKCGLMVKYVERDKAGTYTYYHIDQNTLASLSLFRSISGEKLLEPQCHPNGTPVAIKMTPTCHSNDNRGGTRITTKDPSINNSSINIKIPQEFIDYAMKFQCKCFERKGKLAPEITNKLISDSATTIKKLVEIDGFSFDYIVEVLTWAETDDFWGNNIRSLSTLRSKSSNNGLQKFQNIATSYESNKNKKQHGTTKHSGFNPSYYGDREPHANSNELF